MGSVLQYLLQAIKLFIIAIVISFSLFLIKQSKPAHYFPIKEVNIYGVNHLNQQEVQISLFPLVKGSFFAVNVASIRNQLLQMPWVADTYVRRSWPNQIDITIVEKKAIAKWNEQNLLSSAGELFSPVAETYPNNLPQFSGPDGKHMVMLQNYDEMNRILYPLHAKISYLELTPYLTWKLKLDNGIVLRMGHKDILTRLSHFVKVYPKIVGERTTDVDYVDLRYSNGVAVRWKDTHKNLI